MLRRRPRLFPSPSQTRPDRSSGDDIPDHLADRGTPGGRGGGELPDADDITTSL